MDGIQYYGLVCFLMAIHQLHTTQWMSIKPELYSTAQNGTQSRCSVHYSRCCLSSWYLAYRWHLHYGAEKPCFFTAVSRCQNMRGCNVQKAFQLISKAASIVYYRYTSCALLNTQTSLTRVIPEAMHLGFILLWPMWNKAILSGGRAGYSPEMMVIYREKTLKSSWLE